METQPMRKKVIFSGIQPTGNITIGNYIGALRNWKLLEDEYNCLYCVVDLHSLTVRRDPALLRKSCYDSFALLLAVGLDPDKSLIYLQSHVPQHAELSWVLDCYAYNGELSRMTQFKEKSAQHADNINVGLFNYPVLMAADILLYQTDLVPVGTDQKQHLELARDIAIRFNNAYSPTFVVPEPYIPKAGAKIMSLQDPESKMSKSDPEETYIALLDDPTIIRKKIRRAVTDSEGSILYDVQNKPGISNLMTILSVLTDTNLETITSEYDGKGYGVFKDAVADCIIETLAPLQKRFKELIADKAYLEATMRKNAELASKLATRTLSKVHKKVGLIGR